MLSDALHIPFDAILKSSSVRTKISTWMMNVTPSFKQIQYFEYEFENKGNVWHKYFLLLDAKWEVHISLETTNSSLPYNWILIVRETIIA